MVNSLKTIFDYTNDRKSIYQKFVLAKNVLHDTNYVNKAYVPLIFIKKSLEIIIDYVLEQNKEDKK